MIQHFEGMVYRAHIPRFASSPMSGEGAKRHGGRFNPQGTAALYTSIEVTTAIAEHQQGFLHRPQPTMLCAYEVDCKDILDLTDIKTRAAYDIALETLSCPWREYLGTQKTPPSWQVYTHLTQQGIAGIIAPSYAPSVCQQGRNLIFWDWSDIKPHKVIVIDDQQRLKATTP